MEPKELRIGNYVYENEDISEIQLADFYNMHEDDNCPFKPIELTQEWLVKFGFEKDRINEDFYFLGIPNKYKVYLSISLQYLSFEVCQNGHGFNIDIGFVHQLQNLYFSLTGEELKIT